MSLIGAGKSDLLTCCKNCKAPIRKLEEAFNKLCIHTLEFLDSFKHLHCDWLEMDQSELMLPQLIVTFPMLDVTENSSNQPSHYVNIQTALATICLV